MPRALYSFALDADLRDALQRIKERDGITASEQIRRGIRLWLEQNGAAIEADSRRPEPISDRRSRRPTRHPTGPVAAAGRAVSKAFSVR